MPPTENNHQGNQRLLLVINMSVEAEKKTRTMKLAVQTVSGSLHPRTFMVMLGGNPSAQISILVCKFQSEERNSMVS